ncbi:MAG TPA: MFS transporter [Vicinamibacterales bacterium]|nr:MFS transporter [Vicinamibacterales bacterium]
MKTSSGIQVTATAFAALFAIVGLALYGLPLYYDFMVRELGWSRTMVTSGNAISKLVVGPLFGFAAGWIVDRFGPRRLMMAGILMAGGALIGLGATSLAGAFYFFYFFNALGYVCGGPLPCQVLVSRWFDKTRGKVMGIAYLGIGVGGAIVPLLAAWMTAHVGWRMSLQLLGGLVVLIALPLAYFVRESPDEDDRLKPSRSESHARLKPSRYEDANPSRYEDAKPSRDEDAKPSRYEDAKPSRDQAAKPSRYEDAKPSRYEDAKPSRYEDAKPSRYEDAKPSRYEDAKPSRDDDDAGRLTPLRLDDNGASRATVARRLQPSASIPEILRTPAFYLLAIGSMCSIAAVGGTNQHLKLFLSLDRGYSQADAAGIISLVLTISIVGRLLMGWLADRMPRKHVMLLIYVLVAAAIPLLMVRAAPGAAPMYAFAAVFGLGLGGEYLIIPLMAGELFGIGVLGRVMGIVLTADGVAEATAPMLVGYMRDRTGSYNTGFFVLVTIALVGAAAIALLPRATRVREAPSVL